MENCRHDIPLDIECPQCASDKTERDATVNSIMTCQGVLAVLKELQQNFIDAQNASYEPSSYYEMYHHKEDAISEAISTIEYRMKYGA